LGLPDGLGQPGVGSRPAGLFADVVSYGGEQHEPGGGEGGVVLYGVGEFYTVHPGHVHVDDRQVIRGVVLGGLAQCLEGARGVFGHPVAHPPGEDLPVEDLAVCGVIVDDEHPQAPKVEAGRHSGPRRAFRALLEPGGEPEGGT
jgi:hypothetical protein